MDKPKPISDELQAFLPVIAETMKFATQAVRESVALAELLIEKGVLTRAELDAKLSSTQEPTKRLHDLLEVEAKKIGRS